MTNELFVYGKPATALEWLRMMSVRDKGEALATISHYTLGRIIAEMEAVMEALSLAEAVYRMNCVAPGEPSSILTALQEAIAHAKRPACIGGFDYAENQDGSITRTDWRDDPSCEAKDVLSRERLFDALTKALARADKAERERDKWLDAFNRSEQFQTAQKKAEVK